MFGCTGAALIMISVADKLGLSQQEASSWMFALYFFGGLIGVILSLKYKMPISGAYTIAGTLMLLNVRNYKLTQFSGAFLASGVIILIVGLLGLKEKLLKVLPLPIIMGMVGGSLTRFLLTLIEPIGQAPLIAIVVVISFLFLPKIFKRVPAILLGLIAGIVFSLITKSLAISDISTTFIPIKMVIPEFSLSAFFSISIPMSILMMGSENAQAMGVLIAQGYNPPINAMTVASGVGTILASFFGGHAANIAGPMTAICSSDDVGKTKEDRYIASVINGIIFIVFGLFVSIAISFVSVLPKVLINTISALSMVGVLKSSYKHIFETKIYKNGAILTYIIALSGIEIFNIGAPILAMILGLMLSFLKDDRKKVDC